MVMCTRRSLHGTAAAAVLLIGVVGCSTVEEGSATPNVAPNSQQSSTAPLGSNPNDSISLSVDPCELTSVEDLNAYGEFINVGPREAGGARSCVFQRSSRGGNQGFVVALNVRDAQSLDTVADVGGGVTKTDVNGRAAARSANPDLGDCTFAMEIDEQSRIDVSVNGLSSIEDTCPIAEGVAHLIEPRLPQVP